MVTRTSGGGGDAHGRGHALEAEAGVSDMCLLEPVTEDTCMHNLQQRFQHDLIYTYIGNVVVSINPYKQLPLYTHSVIFHYRSRNIYELPPHIYAISDDAYRSMRDRNQDQCVIISGESGSGKTEASKVIMQYVAAVSGKGREIDRVKEQLLQSNPVLEAFGNAKTNRNDNSSRFGKYMDIEFDFKGDPVGGVITNYLLEKSRVVEQAPGERSFHIFYQLLAGADPAFLKSLKLDRKPDNYALLRNSKASVITGVDDTDMYNVVTNAMLVIGFTEAEVVSLYQLVACVLKLGNIGFKHYANLDGTDGCQLLNQNELEEVSDLLQVDVTTLLQALTSRTVNAMKEAVKTHLSAVEALYARDALCKALYSRLFTWLVERINESIQVRGSVRCKSMGVLDIYGFELFENNGFEQFIINYCNEKLQQIFIELTLKEEQEEYVKEGIEWIHVDYFNNAVICDLIEANRTGILAMLDEECLRPGQVTDHTFLEKLDSHCGNHKHYESRGCRKNINDKSIPHEAFRLVHYAGTVTYRVDGFIDKNNDLLFRDLSRAMYNCQHPFLKSLFPEGNPVKRSLRRPPTAGAQFKKSVNELMKNLGDKAPNYIRCIKPNEHKQPDLFDERLVRHQVRYLGLMENIRVKRAGYAFRQKYAIFLFRYKMLCEDTWPHYRGHARDGVQVLLDYLCVSQEEYAFGRSKIFISNPRTLFSLEATRKEKLHDLATLVQKIWRGHSQKMKFRQMKAAEIKIASYYRMYKARERYRAVQRATLVICCFTRGWKARKLYRAMVYHKKCEIAQVVIEKYFRGWQARTLYRAKLFYKRSLKARVVLTKFYRGWKARKLYRAMVYHRDCVRAQKIIQAYFRGWQVRKQYRAKFRAIAGPKIYAFMQRALRFRFLIRLSRSLPSSSPIDRTWPDCSPLHRNTSNLLRSLHHKNRCAIYRQSCDKTKRNIMREKVACSDIFKARKDCYPQSVNHPFRGDYVSLRQNPKWRKIACETNDQQVVFADIVNKINRKNGKTISQLLVLSSEAMLLLDQRTLSVKYRIPVTQVESFSLSPFHDTLVAFHLKKRENNDALSKKGDFLLISDHVLEVVTKLFLLIQNQLGTSPAVHITTQIVANLNGRQVEIAFKPGVPDIPPGSVKISRKGARMEVLEP